MLVSVVIPCYNEAQTIEMVVSQVLSVNIGLRKEIIVIDDCSTDKSPEILAKLLSDGQIDQLKLFHAILERVRLCAKDSNWQLETS